MVRKLMIYHFNNNHMKDSTNTTGNNEQILTPAVNNVSDVNGILSIAVNV